MKYFIWCLVGDGSLYLVLYCLLCNVQQSVKLQQNLNSLA